MFPGSTGPCPCHGGHLGALDKSKLLGQQGAVGEVDLGPDGLVDGAVAKVDHGGAQFQVRGGNNGVDGELHWAQLRVKGEPGSPTAMSHLMHCC